MQFAYFSRYISKKKIGNFFYSRRLSKKLKNGFLELTKAVPAVFRCVYLALLNKVVLKSYFVPFLMKKTYF